MNNLSTLRLLVISDGSVSYEPPAGVEVLNLRYSFTHAPSPDNFLAWWQGDSMLAVDERCRALNGGFRQQVLNRLVTQYLLKNRVHGVVIIGLYGCTLDLPRIFNLFKIPVAWILQADAFAQLEGRDPIADACVKDALGKVAVVNDNGGALAALQPAVASTTLAQVNSALLEVIADIPASADLESQYDYSLYEFSLRDHPLLCLIQQPDVKHFSGCERVLDLGCGVGIFLSLLQEENVSAVGVERNPDIANYGRGMGLDIITADALKFLEQTEERFDGIYCSHFVEHLPIELVQQLITNLARVVSDNGVVVLAFPDPESIRSQLLGFWRDPEHVRFYHPELVLSLAQAVGLDAEWTSYQDQPHNLAHFDVEPPAVAKFLDAQDLPLLSTEKVRNSWIDKVLATLGIASNSQLKNVETLFASWQKHLSHQQQVITRQQQVIEQLTRRTDQLWAVNNTWAWNDNAVLKLRRRKRCP